MPYSACDDIELAERVSDGDDHAFHELWRRHWPSARAFANRFEDLIDPDDAVQESFIKLHGALRAGNGPNTAFRSYLYRIVHNVAISAGRRTRATPVGDRADLDTLRYDGRIEDEQTTRVLERTITSRAYMALPERWKTVLWFTAVEDMPVQDVAVLLGLTPNATAVLAKRAREGFKLAWLEAHTNTEAKPYDCVWCIKRMARLHRGSLHASLMDRMSEHLDSCDACTIIYAQIDDLASSLKFVLLPLAALGSATAPTGAEVAAEPHLAPVGDRGGAGTPDACLPEAPSMGRHARGRERRVSSLQQATKAAALSSAVILGLTSSATGITDATASPSHGPTTPATTVTGSPHPTTGTGDERDDLVRDEPGTATIDPWPVTEPSPATIGTSEEMTVSPTSHRGRATTPGAPDAPDQTVEDHDLLPVDDDGAPTEPEETDQGEATSDTGTPDANTPGAIAPDAAIPDGDGGIGVVDPDPMPPEDPGAGELDDGSNPDPEVTPGQVVSVHVSGFTPVAADTVAVPVTVTNLRASEAPEFRIYLPYTDGYYRVESIAAQSSTPGLIEPTVSSHDGSGVTVVIPPLPELASTVVTFTLSYNAKAWADLEPPSQWCSWERPPSSLTLDVQATAIGESQAQPPRLEIPGLIACTDS